MKLYNIYLKYKALNLIKLGIKHLVSSNWDPELSILLEKANNLAEEHLYIILRQHIRKHLSDKWRGSSKWHKKCDKLLPVLNKKCIYSQ
ncbi:hypothetical protein [uncultured Clostridium sp.]|uniref:hypothetical protein n=1 Tax=uncultured Clostridium sp. TaxID=59620 RepID=UPI0028E2B7A4|nr:hypothetical protein [uncultured Clostridium sp.]